MLVKITGLILLNRLRLNQIREGNKNGMKQIGASPIIQKNRKARNYQMDYVKFGNLSTLYISKMAQVITSKFILENEEE